MFSQNCLCKTAKTTCNHSNKNKFPMTVTWKQFVSCMLLIFHTISFNYLQMGILLFSIMYDTIKGSFPAYQKLSLMQYFTIDLSISIDRGI